MTCRKAQELPALKAQEASCAQFIDEETETLMDLTGVSQQVSH